MAAQKSKKKPAEKKDDPKKNTLKESTSKKKKAEQKAAPKDNRTEKKTQQLEEQLASEKDRALRLSAEFENYKKRKQRELDDFKRFANESVFKQLLTVVDNFERAIASQQNHSDLEGLLKGVELIHKEIVKLLETFSVKTVDAENQTFDPNFHQAVTQEETDEVPDNTVTQVLQKGYLLHDRLIRPAMVIVSKNKTENKNKEK